MNEFIVDDNASFMCTFGGKLRQKFLFTGRKSNRFHHPLFLIFEVPTILKIKRVEALFRHLNTYRLLGEIKALAPHKNCFWGGA